MVDIIDHKLDPYQNRWQQTHNQVTTTDADKDNYTTTAIDENRLINAVKPDGYGDVGIGLLAFKITGSNPTAKVRIDYFCHGLGRWIPLTEELTVDPTVQSKKVITMGLLCRVVVTEITNATLSVAVMGLRNRVAAL
jgi:hypothetical protein